MKIDMGYTGKQVIGTGFRILNSHNYMKTIHLRCYTPCLMLAMAARLVLIYLIQELLDTPLFFGTVLYTMVLQAGHYLFCRGFFTKRRDKSTPTNTTTTIWYLNMTTIDTL